MLIVFDLDGTLSDDSHRQHYVAKPNRDFKSYYAGMSLDKPIVPVVNTMLALAARHDVEIWTGRPEQYRQCTVDWLLGIPYIRLRMRADGDNRSGH